MSERIKWRSRALDAELALQRLRSLRSRRARELALTIAAKLFVSGSGTKPDRLVLAVDNPNKRGEFINLGGWCERSVADQAEEVLKGGRLPRTEAADLVSDHGLTLIMERVFRGGDTDEIRRDILAIITTYAYTCPHCAVKKRDGGA